MLNPSPLHGRIAVCAALVLAATGANAQAASYKDGTYTGDTVIEWGPISVKVVIQGGKITDVQFLKMPDDRPRSIEITEFAQPRLKSEILSVQSAQIHMVTSATVTSYGVRTALVAALAAAKK
jgi:uncharacterized protein with FMN-binding domain